MRFTTRKIRDMVVFALLAATMMTTQIALFSLPGIQFNGLIIAAITLAYRKRALIPIYVYVMLYCLHFGFNWLNFAYFYIWLPLWGMFMLAGKLKIKADEKAPVYMLLCGLYGLSFGLLYAPVNAMIFGLDFHRAMLWVKAGFFFADVPHGITNFVLGIGIFPLSELLKKLDRGQIR